MHCFDSNPYNNFDIALVLHNTLYMAQKCKQNLWSLVENNRCTLSVRLACCVWPKLFIDTYLLLVEHTSFFHQWGDLRECEEVFVWCLLLNLCNTSVDVFLLLIFYLFILTEYIWPFQASILGMQFWLTYNLKKS